MSLLVYKSETDPKEEVLANRKMLECAVGALDQLCPKLKFLVYPSGTKVSLPPHAKGRCCAAKRSLI